MKGTLCFSAGMYKRRGLAVVLAPMIIPVSFEYRTGKDLVVENIGKFNEKLSFCKEDVLHCKIIF